MTNNTKIKPLGTDPSKRHKPNYFLGRVGALAVAGAATALIAFTCNLHKPPPDTHRASTYQTSASEQAQESAIRLRWLGSGSFSIANESPGTLGILGYIVKSDGSFKATHFKEMHILPKGKSLQIDGSGLAGGQKAEITVLYIDMDEKNGKFHEKKASSTLECRILWKEVPLEQISSGKGARELWAKATGENELVKNLFAKGLNKDEYLAEIVRDLLAADNEVDRRILREQFRNAAEMILAWSNIYK